LQRVPSGQSVWCSLGNMTQEGLRMVSDQSTTILQGYTVGSPPLQILPWKRFTLTLSLDRSHRLIPEPRASAPTGSGTRRRLAGTRHG
jgi:hypothetical protein